MLGRRNKNRARVVVIAPDSVKHDATIVRLTAQAEEILTELDTVVREMSRMLKESVSND